MHSYLPRIQLQACSSKFDLWPIVFFLFRLCLNTACIHLINHCFASIYSRVLPSEYFRPHMGALEKTLAWIEAHQLEEIIPDYCDPISLKCYGKTLTGWNSPHLTPENSPQAWSTAQTASCLIQMRRVVRELMHDDVLSEFRGLKNNNGPSMAAWDRLLDTDIGDPTRGCDTLKNVMDDRVLTPFANGVSSPSFGASYSCILFGPPGKSYLDLTREYRWYAVFSYFHLG